MSVIAECPDETTDAAKKRKREEAEKGDPDSVEQRWNTWFKSIMQDIMRSGENPVTPAAAATTKKQLLKKKLKLKPDSEEQQQEGQEDQEEQEEQGEQEDQEEQEEQEDQEEQDDDEKESDDDDDDDEADLEAMTALLGKNAALLLLGNKRLGNDIWKRDLTEDEVKRYSFIFEKLDDMELDVPKILRSNLSDTEKEHAIYIMLNHRCNSQPYEDVARLIIHRRTNPLSTDRLARYDYLEKQLSQGITERSTLKYQIMDLPIPEKHMIVVWEIFESLQRLEPGTGDYNKLYEWMQCVLKLPWGKLCPLPVFRDTSDLRQKILSMRDQLDQNVYGLSGIKEELQLFSMDRLIPRSANVSQRTGKILAIEGSPGVGKTYLLKTLAKSWGIPFVGIAAGGCRDSSFWDGHLITYEGAVEGRIVKALKQAKTMNPMICIDEIDKLSEHEHGKDVTGILLHILDETQNSEFCDKYVGGDLPLDLSNVMWVVLLNDRQQINPVLRDRLYILKVPDPKAKEKVEMSRQIMIPDMMAVYGLTEEDIEIPAETISYIIESKTSGEKGVRKLKQLLEAIIRRVAYLKHTLVSLPTSAIYHAAATNILQSLQGIQAIGGENQQQMSRQDVAKERSEQKQKFAKQTSFYFPEFRLPVLVTKPVAEKLLSHYEVEEQFDYRAKGWIV